MEMRITRREILAAFTAYAISKTLPAWAHADALIPALVDRIIREFVNESTPDGGVDRTKSIWQKPGRGAAIGGNAFPGDIDPRYFRFEAEAFYRLAPGRADGAKLREVADAHVGFMARHTPGSHPSWAIGNCARADRRGP